VPKNVISIIIFPGSNCDRDLAVAIEKCMGIKPEYIWHNTSHMKKSDMIFLPGGFSFGDYLRAGTIATKSPAIKELIRLSKKGVPVIGICNGFQILTECNLLQGALIKNSNQVFKCDDIYLKVENDGNKFTRRLKKNKIVNFPIAHSQGNFFSDDSTLKSLEDNDQIIFRYSSKNGVVNKKNNPNGSIDGIAGIINKKKNILGLMPHPERAIEKFTSKDGIKFFEGLREIL
tara:strand:- start:3092 stop:3784 length:693 start_codon:yes stop_codon:yes gene_type:complete